MSTYYLIDQFSDQISSVETPPGTSLPSLGYYVVRVPPGVAIQNPTDLNDLLTKKYLGIKAMHAGYSYMLSDDLLPLPLTPFPGNFPYIDKVNSTGITYGKDAISLYPGGTFQTIGLPALSSTPQQAIIDFEVYTFSDANPSDGKYSRTYQEYTPDPSGITCQVSFDGGSTFLTTTSGSLLAIPTVNRGTSFVLKLQNVTSPGVRLFLGSWSIVY